MGMPRRYCSIEGCDDRCVGWGWCCKHYKRWKRYGDPLTPVLPRGDDEGRFWYHVDKNGPVPPHLPELGQCWVWTGALVTSGYGNFYAQGRSIRAHQFAYKLMCGPIVDGLFVLHRCDNRACCRGDHLWLGTGTDNMRDMAAKGRKAITRGESHGMAKLTEDDVRAIRREHRRRVYGGDGGNTAELAQRFGVSIVTIGYIAQRKTWRHVA